MKILWHGGEQEWLFRVIPYIRYRESTRRAVIPDGCHLESILIEVIPDIFYRESIFGLISDGSPPTTCGDDRSELSFPLAFGGNPGCLPSIGSPPSTCGDDSSESSFPLAFGGNPGCLPSDGSPLTTFGDDD